MAAQLRIDAARLVKEQPVLEYSHSMGDPVPTAPCGTGCAWPTVEDMLAQASDDQHATQTLALDTVAALQAQLAALQGTVAASLQALLADCAARQAPKTVTLHRDPAGTLVGTVQDPDGQTVRRLALARTADGYSGEVA